MLTSHELLGFMSPALALEILTYVYETDKPLYRAVLARIMQTCSLELAPSYVHAPQALITLRPGHGMPMLARPLPLAGE